MVLCFCAGLLLLFPAKSLCEQGWVTVRKGIGRTAGRSGVLFFSDSFHGWAVGMMSPGQFLQEGVNVKGILSTQDGGHTWDEVFIEGLVVNEELKSLNAVYFLNANEGWVGGSNVIAYTRDGGKNWQIIPLHYKGEWPNNNRRKIILNVYGIYFANSEEGWVSVNIRTGTIVPMNDSGNVVLHTTDAGKTWETQLGRRIDARYLQFLTPREGWLYGCQLYFTGDRGRTWELRQSSAYPNGICRAYFGDAMEGWAISNDVPQKILHTVDGGRTWETQATSREGFHNITFANARVGWVVGGNGLILQTTDGGNTWVKQEHEFSSQASFTANFTDVEYLPGNGVFVLGSDDGTILKRELTEITPVTPQGKMPITWGRIKKEGQVKR